MRCKFYTFDIDTMMSTGVVASIINHASLKQYHTKATDDLAYGLDLGYWTPRRSATPGTVLEPNVYLVINADNEHHTIEDTIITHENKRTGKRFLKIVGKDETEEISEQAAVVYLPPADHNVSLRFLNDKILKAENKLTLGYITKDNVVPQATLSKSGRAIYPRVSKPGILIAYVNETYQFQYWDTLKHALHLISFSFDGENIIVTGDEIKFKTGDSAKPKDHRTSNRNTTSSSNTNYHRHSHVEGILGMMLREQVPEITNRRNDRNKRSRRYDKYEDSRWK